VLGCYPGSQRQRDELGEQFDLAASELSPAVTFQGAVHQCLRLSLDIITPQLGVRSSAEASVDAFLSQSGCSSDISHQNFPSRDEAYSEEHSIREPYCTENQLPLPWSLARIRFGPVTAVRLAGQANSVREELQLLAHGNSARMGEGWIGHPAA
jgi:hypothetical protein